MCEDSALKRLKAVTPVREDLIDEVIGPDGRVACRDIWDDVWAAINKACAEANRTPVEESWALHEPTADDIALCPRGYYPAVVSVQTVPA